METLGALVALEQSIDRWQLEIDLETEDIPFKEIEEQIMNEWGFLKCKCGLCNKYSCPDCPLSKIGHRCLEEDSFYDKIIFEQNRKNKFFFKQMLLATLKTLNELEWEKRLNKGEVKE